MEFTKIIVMLINETSLIKSSVICQQYISVL